MENGCEHEESSPIGKCAICERTVCQDCYRDLFSTMICDLHPGLEDDSDWELVGFYAAEVSLTERRYVLEEQGIISLVVDGDEEAVELYVPAAEKAEACELLGGSADEMVFCEDCQIRYTRDLGTCPICGVKPVVEADPETGGK